MKTPEPVQSDKWLLKPRASNDIELAPGCFKAFGWIVIQAKPTDASETSLDQNDDSDDLKV